MASLEAELARLREMHASDADQVAEMLVRIAEAERARKASEARAAESDSYAETLSVALGVEKARTAQLEADNWENAEGVMRDLRARLEAAETGQARMKGELAAALEAMAGAVALLEDLERREEMVAAVRLRTFDELKRNLGVIGATTQPPAPAPEPPIQAMPIKSIAPMKPMKATMAEPEPFLDLDLSE